MSIASTVPASVSTRRTDLPGLLDLEPDELLDGVRGHPQPGGILGAAVAAGQVVEVVPDDQQRASGSDGAAGRRQHLSAGWAFEVEVEDRDEVERGRLRLVSR